MATTKLQLDTRAALRRWSAVCTAHGWQCDLLRFPFGDQAANSENTRTGGTPNTFVAWRPRCRPRIVLLVVALAMSEAEFVIWLRETPE